jgi:hypothetical protein
MKYSATVIADTTSRERVAVDPKGLTVTLREGNAPRMTITLKDDGAGRVFYTVHTYHFGKKQVHESVTYYNVTKK